jgi:hypothetical protein
MNRFCITRVLAAVVGLVPATQAIGQSLCRPTLTFKDIEFSEMQPPTMERKWSAIVSVDASHCAANSEGRFEVVFTRLKENGLELDFHEPFAWRSPSVKVSVDFWADEAPEVKGYRIDNVSTCPCPS